MNQLRVIVTAVLAVSAALALAGPPAARPQESPGAKAAPPPPAGAKWESAIAAFEAYDRRNTPARDAILFVGSSSIVNWPTAASFKDWTVLNRGFGGSTIAELNGFVARIVTRYQPRAIILYSGDNDAAAGRSARQIAADFNEFVRLVRKDMPRTPIFCLSIKPSGARWKLWPTMQEANGLIADACKAGANLHFIDVGALLLGGDGAPKAEPYLEDKLHLSPAGYELWTKKVHEAVSEVLKR